jgi:predicted RNase H-like HicB family nuclease
MTAVKSLPGCLAFADAIEAALSTAEVVRTFG